MNYHLRTYDQSPPGLYSYAATEGSIRIVIPPQPVIESVAKTLADIRGANRLPRASVKEALQDVDGFTCARLGNDPAWCVPSNGMIVSLSSASPIIAPPCSGCGAPIE